MSNKNKQRVLNLDNMIDETSVTSSKQLLSKKTVKPGLTSNHQKSHSVDTNGFKQKDGFTRNGSHRVPLKQVAG